jgi:CheY-like chemotaxis protein
MIMRDSAVPSQPLQRAAQQSPAAGGMGGADPDRYPDDGADQGSTILVVEDDILVRMAAADHLRDVGHRVLEAADGEEARTLLRASEPIQVVFSDVNMPGMDGVQLARWIAEEFPGVKVVLTSGDSSNAAAARSVTHFLAKPYDLDTLGRLIKQLL